MKGKFFFFCYCLCLIMSNCVGQEAMSGVYFTQPWEANCALERKLVNNNIKLCIVEEPVISTNEIVAVTDIFYDEKVKSNAVVLVLNDAGRNQLYSITSRFKGQTLAIIIDDHIVSAVAIEKEIIGGEILLYDNATSKTLKWIRRKLLRIIRENEKK